jgi:hypothetical protein
MINKYRAAWAKRDRRLVPPDQTATMQPPPVLLVVVEVGPFSHESTGAPALASD